MLFLLGFLGFLTGLGNSAPAMAGGTRIVIPLWGRGSLGAYEQQQRLQHDQRIEYARETWSQLDSETLDCVRTRHFVNVDLEIRNGVAADAPRYRDYVADCENIVSAQRQQQQAEAAAQQRRADLVAKYGETDAEEILNHAVVKGMTADELLESRGAPDRKLTSPPSDELWIYGNQNVALSGGRVTITGD